MAAARSPADTPGDGAHGGSDEDVQTDQSHHADFAQSWRRYKEAVV